MPETKPASLLPGNRRELRALRFIVKHLANVGTPGRIWLRDLLTQDLERRHG